jgi:AraC family transcriptional regulator
MERARRLLRETQTPIVEIGLEVGYASPSHFAQVFRKEVGVLPSDYRHGR